MPISNIASFRSERNIWKAQLYITNAACCSTHTLPNDLLNYKVLVTGMLSKKLCGLVFNKSKTKAIYSIKFVFFK